MSQFEAGPATDSRTQADFRWETICDLVDETDRPMAADAGLEIDGQFLTYGEIRERARRIAANLHAAGIGKGDRVASLMSSRIEAVLTWFGTNLAGAIWSPLNSSLIKDDLAGALLAVQPKAVIADILGSERLLDPAVSYAMPPIRYLVAEEGMRPAAGFLPFKDLLDVRAPFVPVDIGPGDPALIIFTGGSTGMPKGVVLPHFACLGAGYRYAEAFGATSEDRHFAVSPLFHAGGLFVGLLGPMVAGMRVTIDRQFSASAYWARVRETRATIINPPGVTLTMLCQKPASEDDRNHSVRIALGLTSQLPEEIPGMFTSRFGIELVNLYALTEASGALIVYNPPGTSRPKSNGRGGRWAEIAIADNEGRLLPAGKTGRILLRPKIPHTFMIGYHNDPEATARAFRNLWLNTSDLGFLDEDGYLYFVGREAHWLRRRGENISAYDVEHTIAKYPGVADAAVVGVPAEIGEEEVKVFIVRQAGCDVEPSQLVRWCVSRMAAFKVPRFIEFLDVLPRSSVKPEVDRVKLKRIPNDSAWDREAVFGRQLPPAETLESRVQ